MTAAERTKRNLQSIATACGLVALLVMASLAHGAGSPFVSLSGPWAGSGTVTLANGAKEAIRCRAHYHVESGGANMRLDLRCSSDSFKFELQSNVAHSHGEITGQWSESTTRVGGTLAGKASGERIEVRVEGSIAAMLTVSTRADQQSVSIRSPGGPMSHVAISLSRGTKQVAMK